MTLLMLTKPFSLYLPVVLLFFFRDLLQRTGVQRSQVGVVVVNSSVFCPTPSLAAQLMNHLKLNPSTLHYNLGGMGCAGEAI
jgi:3-ketoacyl-CoA synthase